MTAAVLGGIFILIVLSVLNNISIIYPLTAGLLLTGADAVLKGCSLKSVIYMAYEGIRKSAIIYKIFVLIGAIISTWIACGTVPGLMYYGFMIIKPEGFIILAFLLTSIVSLLLGTSFGTISTVGIALMAIGRGFGINPGIVAGAIISGAYLGDRSSPMSSSALLTSIITESDLYDNLKHMMSTLIPSFLVAIVFYGITGLFAGNLSANMDKVMGLQNAIRGSFNITVLVLIPPIIILLLAAFNVNIKVNMLIGIISGSVLALFLQHMTILKLLQVMLFGYSMSMDNQALCGILKGGGVISMVKTSLVIAVSSGLNGIFEGTGMLDEILSFLMKNIGNPGGLVLRTALMSIITAMYGCSQTLSIMMTGYAVKPSYKKMGVSNSSFARAIADTSVVLSPLIPWNIAGLVPAVNLNVGVIDFIPFAYLCIILPLVTILYAYMGKLKMNMAD